MTIFGVPFDELDAERLQAYLDQAGDEPLLWEAKGTEVRAKEIRRQVCAFANSHEGGYLILGAEQTAAAPDHEDGGEPHQEGGEPAPTWRLAGVPFPDEPQTWISNVIGDPEQGVRPRPDFNVVAWQAARGHVAVLHVAPTSTPPCIANGTVYERIPGKTQEVRDPQILASLFARGDQARTHAQARADRAASTLLRDWLPGGGVEFMPRGFTAVADETTEEADEGDQGKEFLRFAVGISTTGNPPDISSRLFRGDFATEVWTELRDRPSNLPEWMADAPPDHPYWSQEALTWRQVRTVDPVKSLTVVRALWDGSVAAGQKLMTEDVHPDDFADTRIAPQWEIADRLTRRLGGFGDVYVTVAVVGGRFPRRMSSEPIIMKRGPILAGVEDGHVKSLGRELMRAVGNPAPEG